MVYFKTFREFEEAASQLVEKRPHKTRFCIKYREGKMVLKVTDDCQCIKYRTSQREDLLPLQSMMLPTLRNLAQGKPQASQSGEGASSSGGKRR